MGPEASERPSRTERLVEALFSEGAGIYDGVELTPGIKSAMRKISHLVHGDREGADEDTGAMFLGGMEVLGQGLLAAKNVAEAVRGRLNKALGRPERKPQGYNRQQDC